MSVDRIAVLDAAAQLLAVDPRASTSAIAAAAGISRASVHRLFPTRDDLVRELTEVAMARAASALEAARPDAGSVVEVVGRLVPALLPSAAHYGFLTREVQLDGSSELGARVDALYERTADVFRRGQESGELRVDLPAPWLVQALFWLLVGAADSVRNGIVAPRDAARLVVETFVADLRREPVGAAPAHGDQPAAVLAEGASTTA